VTATDAQAWSPTTMVALPSFLEKLKKLKKKKGMLAVDGCRSGYGTRWSC